MRGLDCYRVRWPDQSIRGTCREVSDVPFSYSAERYACSGWGGHAGDLKCLEAVKRGGLIG